MVTKRAVKRAAKKATPAQKPATKRSPGKTVTAKEPEAPKKAKRVHGEFSMPKDDYERIAKLKAAADGVGVKIKKNELLRLGLQALERLSAKQLGEAALVLQLKSMESK